jgi:spore coat protein A, manganese oxidase
MTKINRRSLLRFATIIAAGSVLPIGIITSTFAQAKSRGSRKRKKKSPPKNSPTNQLFQVALPIMPELKPTRSDKTTDYYEITQKTAKVQILPGPKLKYGVTTVCFRVQQLKLV